MNAFSSYHPSVLIVYFLSVMLITMFTMNPVFLAISLFCSICNYASITRLRNFFSDISYYFIFFVLIALTNPLFSHNGVTPLFFLNDNPVTLEAVFCGIAIAALLISIIFWSKYYSKIMTTDKFLYLFGRVIPKLSLVLSMAIRFIPLFKSQIKVINKTQKTLGLYSTKSIVDRMRGGVRVFSALITWSFENSLDTADSMKARGYGLKGRTNFSLFRFEKRDIILLFFIVLILCIISVFMAAGTVDFRYYPVISRQIWSPPFILSSVLFFILSIIPFFIEIKENLSWKLLKSKI